MTMTIIEIKKELCKECTFYLTCLYVSDDNKICWQTGHFGGNKLIAIIQDLIAKGETK